MTARKADIHAGEWAITWRGDPRAREIADRHYNRQTPGAPMFAPPGRALVLLRPGALWITSWPYAEYVLHDWAGAWINSAFRREHGDQASTMIRDAVAATRWRWPDTPDQGMVTFIDRAKIRHKRDPGRCYLKAGFRVVGETRERGLLALQLDPSDMPDPRAPANAQQELAL